MQVELMDKEGNLLCVLNNEDALLGAYPVENSMRLHVCGFCINFYNLPFKS